jgi:glycosyltransferase involved in cell wall biosynthesis
MNILFITEDHSIKNYGITSVVSQLAEQLTIQYEDIKLTILSLGNETVAQNSRINIVLIPASPLGQFWGWNAKLSKTIKQTIEKEKIDLIHIHGIWMAAQWYALKIAKGYHIPCIVSAHGMLTEWLWKNQSFLQNMKKITYLNLVLKPVINQKVVFHSITPIELESLNRQFSGNKKVTIPNAIDVGNGSRVQTNLKPEKQFLFLGRITPIKAVDLLIEAFHLAQLGKEWKLLLAGPEYVPGYVAELKQKTQEYGLEEIIIFTGPIFGQQKIEILQKTWALVIPSYAEVMGMVNLEAAIESVPSITTYETGLLDWEEGGGLLIHPNVEDLTAALQQAATWSIEERIDRGKRSCKLVSEQYSWQTVIPKWYTFYSSTMQNN